MKLYLLALIAAGTEAVKLTTHQKTTMRGQIDAEGWGNLWNWGSNALNWLGDQVDDASQAFSDVVDTVKSGDIMGAISDA